MYSIKFMVFNATFNNISEISWQSYLLVEETGAPGEKPQNCRKLLTNLSLSFNVVSSTPRAEFELTTSVVIGTYFTGSCKSNYHTITTMMAPYRIKLIYRTFQIVILKENDYLQYP
jgi:hypothetical protein